MKIKHKLTPLPCINDENGQTLRPYKIDEEIIFYLNMENVLLDEAEGKNTEITRLANAINARLKTKLSLEDIAIALNEGFIYVES